jgi:alpha/beta superfamily hydrolase
MLVVASDNDFACPIDALREWVKSDKGTTELVVMNKVEHFFRGHESAVVETVHRFLKSPTA